MSSQPKMVRPLSAGYSRSAETRKVMVPLAPLRGQENQVTTLGVGRPAWGSGGSVNLSAPRPRPASAACSRMGNGGSDSLGALPRPRPASAAGARNLKGMVDADASEAEARTSALKAARVAAAHKELHAAVSQGSLSTVQRLVRDPRITVDCFAGGKAPLHTACGLGHDVIARCLLDAGSEVDLCDAKGFTAAFHAAKGNHVATLVVGFPT